LQLNADISHQLLQIEPIKMIARTTGTLLTIRLCARAVNSYQCDSVHSAFIIIVNIQYCDFVPSRFTIFVINVIFFFSSADRVCCCFFPILCTFTRRRILLRYHYFCCPSHAGSPTLMIIAIRGRFSVSRADGIRGAVM